jgi:CheY-like chemotaxis protein
MDVLKVLSIIKTDPNWKKLPVIVCSGHDAQGVKEKVMNAGSDGFLPKRGTSPAQLVQYAKTILQQHLRLNKDKEHFLTSQIPCQI